VFAEKTTPFKELGIVSESYNPYISIYIYIYTDICGLLGEGLVAPLALISIGQCTHARKDNQGHLSALISLGQRVH
jgi:hypothetical protein